MWGETAISKSMSVILLTIIAVAAGGCGSSPEADAWQTTRIQPGGRVTGYPAGSVSIGPPKQVAGQIRIQMLDRLCEDTECRIVAVDYEDRMQVGQTTVELLPGGKSRSPDIVFSGIKLDDIKEFQFQTRLLNQEIIRDNHKSSPNAGVA